MMKFERHAERFEALRHRRAEVAGSCKTPVIPPIARGEMKGVSELVCFSFGGMPLAWFCSPISDRNLLGLLQ